MADLTLHLGGYAPADSSHGHGLATFRKSVVEGTGGAVDVEVTWNILDHGRPAADLLDLVEAGEMFLCYFSTSYLADRVPELAVLDTPYLFSNLDQAHRALEGELGDRLSRAVRAATAFDVLGYWDNGFRHLTNRVRPVRHPDDTRGMRVRLQPNTIHEEMIRAWGAEPVAADLSEGIELIRSLRVDAQENPLANTVSYGVDQVHRHVTMTGHLYGARALLAHRATLERLTPDVAEVVRRAAVTAATGQRREAQETELALRTRLDAEGLAFVDLTPAERSAFMEASAPAMEMSRRRVGEDLFEMAR